jgi:cadmium resistance protein CadD (predicted permease)
MLVIFAVLPALLCYAGKRIADRKCVRSCIQKYQSILVPAVLIALGIMILLEYYCL